MKLRHPLHEFMPYGAPDLLGSGRSHLTRALVVSSSAAALAFLGLALAVPLLPHAPVPIVPDVPFTRHDFLPPVDFPGHHAVAPHVRPAAPPPGAIVNPVKEETKSVDPPGPASTTSDRTAKTDGIPDGPPAPPHDAIQVQDPDAPVPYAEVPPYAVTEVKPEYPDIAQQAMVEGRVVVKILVGRDGHVREAKVDEHQHVLLLDQAAIDAALKWVFTPAQVNGHPVAVWSAIPFVFRLQ